MKKTVTTTYEYEVGDDVWVIDSTDGVLEAVPATVIGFEVDEEDGEKLYDIKDHGDGKEYRSTDWESGIVLKASDFHPRDSKLGGTDKPKVWEDLKRG